MSCLFSTFRLFVIAISIHFVLPGGNNQVLQAEDASPSSKESSKKKTGEIDFSMIPAIALKDFTADTKDSWDDTLPSTLEDLQRFEDVTTKLVPIYRKATVGIQSGGGQGSGVVISPQGHVLTAAHVVGKVDNRVTIVFPDSSRYSAKVVGINSSVDAAIVRIESKGPFNFVPMAQSRYTKPGRWVIATGHPNGFLADRLPVVRLGRVITTTSKTVQTDCSLVGGDSGGPLFDLHGRVVGIHSRIGATSSINFHVPVQAYLREWEELNAAYVPRTKKEKPVPTKAYIGIRGRNANNGGCLITEVTPSGPAHEAGVKRGDILTKCDKKKINTFGELVNYLKTKKANDQLKVTVLRDDQKKVLTVKLGETSQ
ncbi:MAG: serine protease [Planctomycetaceae bacterium]|nr:serine protease [Planctomycetaceae bacterium]